MQWEIVRAKYPHCWVLIEALSAYTINHKRSIEDMSVVSDFDDPQQAWQMYRKRHIADPSRELYVFYTGNESIEVIEQPFTGIRGLQ
ncbi:hypothetical protein ACE3MZ_21870 [Paenibacillus sp. WLX1005]|uniref:hypothetical protein n=1 Tax=Paenibacillus sp. WLX1005 TaxID=3243766 RepID=UPI003983E17D